MQQQEQQIKLRFRKAKRNALLKGFAMIGVGVLLTVLLSLVDIQWMMVGFGFLLIVGTFGVRSIVEDLKRIRQAEKEQLDRVQDEMFRGFHIR